MLVHWYWWQIDILDLSAAVSKVVNKFESRFHQSLSSFSVTKPYIFQTAAWRSLTACATIRSNLFHFLSFQFEKVILHTTIEEPLETTLVQSKENSEVMWTQPHQHADFVTWRLWVYINSKWAQITHVLSVFISPKGLQLLTWSQLSLHFTCWRQNSPKQAGREDSCGKGLAKHRQRRSPASGDVYGF